MNPSNINPLKQQLQQHIEQVQLSDSQFKKLEDLMNQGDAHVEIPADRRLWGSLAVAAMFVVAVVTTFMLSQFSGTSLENMPQLIAEEVVNNHLNMKPLEVKGGSINKVRGYFTKLNFMPAENSNDHRVAVTNPGPAAYFLPA
jgi:hypothetical protein